MSVRARRGDRRRDPSPRARHPRSQGSSRRRRSRGCSRAGPDLAAAWRGHQVEHRAAAFLLDLEQDRSAASSACHPGPARPPPPGRCAWSRKLELVLVVELLEDVGLELLVEANRLESPHPLVAGASTRSAIWAGEAGRSADGERAASSSAVPDERLELGPGDECLVGLHVSPRSARGSRRRKRAAEARVESPRRATRHPRRPARPRRRGPGARVPV